MLPSDCSKPAAAGDGLVWVSFFFFQLIITIRKKSQTKHVKAASHWSTQLDGCISLGGLTPFAVCDMRAEPDCSTWFCRFRGIYAPLMLPRGSVDSDHRHNTDWGRSGWPVVSRVANNSCCPALSSRFSGTFKLSKCQRFMRTCS